MGSDDGTVHEVLEPVELTRNVSLLQELIEDVLPDAFNRPASKPAVDGGPFAEPLRNVAPRRSRSQHPDDPADDGPVVEIRSATANLRRQERVELLPLIVSHFFAAQRQILPFVSEHFFPGQYGCKANCRHAW
jgi:hypothetical protein